MERTYSIGKNLTNNRFTLTVKGTMPFAVWRDVGRLSGVSRTDANGNEVFEFSDSNRLQYAEKVLQGALWQAETYKPKGYACMWCGNGHMGINCPERPPLDADGRMQYCFVNKKALGKL